MSLSKMIMPILIFSIILNLSTGIVARLPCFDGYDLGGLTYSANYNDEWQEATEGINKTISIAGDEVTNSGAQNSVLDFLSLKTYVRFFAVIDSYMYGFINMLGNVFIGPLNSAGTGLGTLLFGGLKTIISFGYILLMFYLFTGRRIDNE